MKLINCSLEVNSTNLHSISWEGKTKELIIIFKNGVVYKYKDFTEDDLLEFINANSMGSYFYKNIRPKYAFEKVEQSDALWEEGSLN